MDAKNYATVILCLLAISRVHSSSSDHLQYNSSRYGECGRYTCPDGGKFKFLQDMVYQYQYALSINSTFDKKGDTHSALKLNFKLELRIENCEGVLRVSRDEEKVGFAVFETDTYDEIYEDISRFSLRFSFYDGSILNVCPNGEESITALNIKKGILSAFQNKMKRFDMDKFTSEKDINGFCPTSYNLQRINGTTLVVRKIKDIANCLERCQLHSIIPTSKFIFQSRFHKWTPLNSTVICHQTIDHSIPVHIWCHEEHMLEILPNQTHSSRTLISQEFRLTKEISLYANFFSILTYPEVYGRGDLSFNHRKPKKSEISELEDSEVLLLQLCNISSVEFQADAADTFAKFIHTARHLSFDALVMLLEKSSTICSTGRKHVRNSLPFLRSTAALSLMKNLIVDGHIPESISNEWMFAMSLFPRPDNAVIESVSPMMLDAKASDEVLLSVSSILHAYNVWSSESDDKDVAIAAITHLEITLNETVVRGENPHKLVVILKALGNAGIQTDSIGYTLASCIRNPTTAPNVKIAAIEAHRRLPCDFNTRFLLDLYTDVEYDAEIRITAYIQLMRCPSYTTVQIVKTMLQTETSNQVGSFVWSHIQNVMKSSLEYRVHLQALLQDHTLQNKFKTDFRKFSRNYENTFYFSEYGVGGVIAGNIIFSSKTYIPTYLNLNLTVDIFGETINVIEVNIFIEGLERYAEKLFKGGTDFLIEKIDKIISSYRFLRAIPMSINEKIRFFFKHMFGSFPEPTISMGVRLFGNEIVYTSCSGQDDIHKLLEELDVGNIFKRFLSGQEIKHDHSTVFMDVSYVSPTGAGVPLNLDVVGISMMNVDTSILMNFTDFSAQDRILIEGKFKPRFSINVEGSMGTDLVYRQTKIEVRDKIYTSSEIEGYLLADTVDNITLSFNLPRSRFDLFSFQSDLYYKNTTSQKDVILQHKSEISDNTTCIWPMLEQTLGLKLCTTYYTLEPEMLLQSLMHVLKGPFRFSLYLEKMDPTAMTYTLKYNRRSFSVNESSISVEFETPHSEIPRSMKTSLYFGPENNNMTISLHVNKTNLEANGRYENTLNDKVLKFDVDINGLRQVDLIAELHVKREKKLTFYSPKLYFAISSKPVVELTGTYRWLEKTGIALGELNLHFKTNKFDSFINGTVSLMSDAITSNIHVNYKFEKAGEEHLKLDFKLKNLSNNLKTTVLAAAQIQSSSYADMNLGLQVKFQSSNDHFDVRFNYVSSPFEENDFKKLKAQGELSYRKSFNGLKANVFIEVKKPITDLDVRFELGYQNSPTTSNAMILIRYAKDKDIKLKLEIFNPQTQLLHYEMKLNATLPSTNKPAVMHIRILEKTEKEYDVDFTGTWFSGHTAMAKGVLQDKSTHFGTSYIIKLQVRSRLFDEISLYAKLNFNELERKAVLTADHNATKYGLTMKHTSEHQNLHDMLIEYVYDNNITYSMNNHLDMNKKEMHMELHLDKYRDMRILATGRLEPWNSNVGFEIKWDVNRDPNQKIVLSFTTKAVESAVLNQYEGRTALEYPGHVTAASFIIQYRGTYKSISLTLEMNPSSVIVLQIYNQNELFTNGIVELGFKLLTPFENWKETSFFSGIYFERQSFRLNGNLTWQSNQNIILNTRGSYKFDERITSLTLSSLLNSTLQDLSVLAFNVNYTSIKNEAYLSFLLQPNARYSLSISTSGIIRRYTTATEYILHVGMKTPFLEYYDNEFGCKLKLMTGNRIIGDTALRLNDDVYTMFVKGYVDPFERSKLCVHMKTPYKKFNDVHGLLFYDLDQRHISISATSKHSQTKVNVMYLYHNFTNFNIRLEIMTPMKQLSNVVLIAMYNRSDLEVRSVWNSFNMGISARQRFLSWTNLEYRVHMNTPIETFKEGDASFKIYLTPDQKIITARVILSNITKIGLNFAYNSEAKKITYFDECDSLFEDDEHGIRKNTILANGLFELDTLIYQTISGKYQLDQTDNRYTLDAKLAVFFLKISVQNYMDFDRLSSFNNSFFLTSSIDMYSNIEANITATNISNSKTQTAVSFEVIRFNQKYDSVMDIVYEYKAINETLQQIKNKIDGLHNIEIRLKTPIESLEEGEITVITQIENKVIQTTAKVVTKNIKISVIGSFEYSQEYLNLNAALDVSSILFSVPAFKLQILRDFYNAEKQIAFVLKEQKTTEHKNIFCIKGSWFAENRDYVSTSGEIITPLKILDELKCKLLYSREIGTDAYNLEASMKYSNKIEMKIRAHLKAPDVTLNLESSMEGLKSAQFTGTLEKIGPGQQKIDATMSSNNHFRILGMSSITDQTPFSIKGRLLRGKEGIEVSSVEMAIRKQEKGYNIIASLYSKGKSLNVQIQITNYPDDIRVIRLIIEAGKGDLEHMNINAELKLQHPGIYVLTVKGDSTMSDIKGSAVTKIEIWFRNSIGAIFATVDSVSLKGKAEIFNVWMPPNFVYGTSKIDFLVEKKPTEVFASKVYFFKENQTFKNFSSGLLIDLKDKWMFETNTTLMINSSNHVQTATYFLMPNKKTYSLVGSLDYNDDYDLIQHFLVISRPVDTPCYTISDVNLAIQDVYGMFAFKCGMKDRLYMMDSFRGKKTASSLVLSNWLKSNTLTNALVTNVNYAKDKAVSTVNVRFFYPPVKQIAQADVHFETTDNFDLFINTTTPYSSMPYFVSEVVCTTSDTVYHRSGKVHLQSKSAIIDIKHMKVPQTGNVLNDGKITIAFPVTTWHEGVLAYAYMNSTVYINGTMELFYNKKRFINGTFSKTYTKTLTMDRDFINLNIGNFIMPVGVNYIHDEAASEPLKNASQDFRRIEVYELEDPSNFNVTGELHTDVIGSQESTSIKIFHFNHRMVIKSSTDGANAFENGFYVTVKPEIWFSYNLKTNKTVTNTSYQKVYDLNLSYPRRNYSIISDLGYGEKHIRTKFMLHNCQAFPQKTIGLSFDTKKVSEGLRETTAVLFHPSFRKNITMFVSFQSLKTILADMMIVLEYADLEYRRFELAAIIENESKQNNDRRYSWRVNGKHPATRFKLDMDGFLRTETGNHFFWNNISYCRSFLPEQFWNGKALLNTNDNIFEVERISTRANILVRGTYKNSSSRHIVKTLVVEGSDTHISGNFEVDPEEKEIRSIVNLTSDASDRLRIDGNIPENREAKLSMWRMYNEFNFPQFTFHVTLNNSRFLSSTLLWRTDISLDVLKTVRKSVSYLWKSAQDALEFWTQFLRAEALEIMIAVWSDAKPEFEEFIEDFHDIKSVQDNIQYFKKLFNDSYNANEFLLKDMHRMYILMSRNMSFVSTLESFPKLLSEIVESMGETSQVIKNSFIWVVNTIRELYEQFLSILDELVEGKAEEYVGRFIRRGSERFDNFIKDLQISFISTLESALTEMISVLSHYQRKLLLIFEPTFIEILHHIDATFWSSSRKFIDFLYTKKNDISPYLLRNPNVTRRLDLVYKDLVRNDFFTNVKKYSGLFFNVIYEYYIAEIPYREELASVGNEIISEIKELYKLPLVAYTVDNIKTMYDQIVWVNEYFDISGKFQKVIPFLYRQLQQSSSTALELQLKSHKPKTKFVFTPENGLVKLEQKLPFPWHAFNETPAYEEIEEYKYLKRIQEFVTTSKLRISSLYKLIFSLADPQQWFPPFESRAQLIGLNHYITFDSMHVPFYGNTCQYLLSHDFVENKFSLVVNSDKNDSEQSVSLLLDREQITIQFKPVRITTSSRKISKFPQQLNNTYVYFDHGIITVESPKGITLKCNVHYRVCTIHLAGWFFGKVSGLLGTMNNEPIDDVFKAKRNDQKNYLWSLSSEKMTCPMTTNVSTSTPDYVVNEKCSKLFTSILNNTSPFEPCFKEIDPAPYYEICLFDPHDDNVCSVATAYVQSCHSASVPLRIPAFCVSCPVNKHNVYEGTFIPLEGRSVPQSSDVVFIVEAKQCNKDIVNRKNIQQLINALSKELINSGLTNNRYSLVLFGGKGIYEKPHSVIIDNSAFSFNTSHFIRYFEDIPVGNGSSDIFAALRFASKLSFRVGVSKNFILLICSNCDPTNMELDYSVLHHAMVEKSIVLHILMEENFPTTEKLKSGKVLFGLDGFTAYTKSDTKSDDRDLHQKTKLTKSLLGYCTPLALESNGTLFTAKPLSDGRLSKKFAAVFAKRVALTARTKDCQMCECHADNNGIPYVECISCLYPTPINFDFNSDEEDDEFSPAIMNFESTKRAN